MPPTSGIVLKIKSSGDDLAGMDNPVAQTMAGSPIASARDIGDVHYVPVIHIGGEKPPVPMRFRDCHINIVNFGVGFADKLVRERPYVLNKCESAGGASKAVGEFFCVIGPVLVVIAHDVTANGWIVGTNLLNQRRGLSDRIEWRYVFDRYPRRRCGLLPW